MKVVIFNTFKKRHEYVAKVLKLFGYKSIYMNIDDKIKSEEKYIELKSKGIEQVIPCDLDDFQICYKSEVQERLATSYYEKKYNDEVLNKISIFFPDINNKLSKVKAVVMEGILDDLKKDIMLISIADYYKNRGHNIKVWANKTSLSNEICEIYLDIKVLIKINFSNIYKIISKIKHKLYFTSRKRIVKNSNVNTTVSDSNNHSVAFFPHEGPYYGNLYIKDQFYSKDVNSSFNKSNIIHFELIEKIEPERQALFEEQYRKEGLPFAYISLGAHQLSIKDMISIAWSCFGLGIKIHDVVILIRVINRIRRIKANLLQFSELKMALIGYEFLYPVWLNYALQSNGIQVVALQERQMLQELFPKWPAIYDIYFVFGDYMKKIMEENPYAAIDEVYAVGDYRVDYFYRKSDRNYFPLETKHKTIVLDWHSDPDAFANRASVSNSYDNNLLFYKSLVKLAKKHPNSHFLIRGKESGWMNIEFFNEIKEEILSQPNIEVLDNYENLLISYYATMQADSIIARYTSLADQALIAGKSVIYYEETMNKTAFIEDFRDFSEYPGVAHSYEELSNMYDDVVENGCLMQPDELNRLVDKFFKRTAVGETKRRVLEILEGSIKS